MSTYTVTAPGRLLDFFGGGDAGQGRPDLETGYVGGHELYEAIEDTPARRVGSGYSVRLTLSRDALQVLWRYCDVCLWANSDEPNHSEVRAARVTADRIRQVYPDADREWGIPG